MIMLKTVVICAFITYVSTDKEVSSQNPAHCTLQESENFKNIDSCYYVIEEKKSWENAENYCQQYYNGHLLTIETAYYDYILQLAIPDGNKDMWIGIKIENSREQKWTSGWYVAYESYSNEIKNISEGSCVARKKSEKWMTVPCSTELPFICEVSKVKAPALKPPPFRAHCPEDQDYWRDFGGEYCYYFEPERYVTFDQANEICISRGGHLASIHSQEEAEVLQQFFKQKQSFIYIGLHREEGENGKFSWMDGTELDYQNWNDGETDRSKERCAAMYIFTKKWNVVPCKETFLGFVCSVKKMPKIDDEHSTLSSRSEKMPKIDDEHSTLSSRSEKNIDETLPAGSVLVLLVVYWFQRILLPF